MQQYLFRQKVQKNCQISKSKNVETLKQIVKFIEKTEEQVNVVTQNQVLSIVPNSKMKLMEVFKFFTPSITIPKNQSVISAKSYSVIKLEPEIMITGDNDHINNQQDHVGIKIPIQRSTTSKKRKTPRKRYRKRKVSNLEGNTSDIVSKVLKYNLQQFTE